MKALRLPKGLPHFADEQICNLEDIEKYGEYFDGVVLKLTKCGGITPSLKMMESVKKNDLMLLAGCMTESSIGINHMLQLLPQFDYADLDGAYLIKNDREVCSIDCESKRILHPDGAFY